MFEPSGNLITCGGTKALRWPIESESGNGFESVHVGAAETLYEIEPTGTLRLGFASLSSDGRTLALLDEAKNPNPGGSIPAYTALRRDGRMIALVYAQKHIVLRDPVTADEIAQLAPADPQPVTHLVFSPDGSQLAVGNFKNQIELWDLSELRSQLDTMGLDWPD